MYYVFMGKWSKNLGIQRQVGISESPFSPLENLVRLRSISILCCPHIACLLETTSKSMLQIHVDFEVSIKTDPFCPFRISLNPDRNRNWPETRYITGFGLVLSTFSRFRPSPVSLDWFHVDFGQNQPKLTKKIVGRQIWYQA